MSDYFKSLDPVARARYLEKLHLLGLNERDDPYLPSNEDRFVEDMSLWPPVEFGHISFVTSSSALVFTPDGS